MFKDSGAQFTGSVTEHADGFAMRDSELTPWNAEDMGPKIDVIGKMASAIRGQRMKFISTFYHQWKSAWYPIWDETANAYNPEYEALYEP